MHSAFPASVLVLACGVALANEVANGSFETDTMGAGAPDQWQSAGAAEVVQRLVRDAGHAGTGFSARLECTRFAGGGPSSHAMVCQVGVVGLKRGTWYRLSLWAKGDAIPGEAIDVAISNTRNWSNTGLSDALDVGPEWQSHEVVFQASQDLAPADSRLQFWFHGTGTLWLDEVDLTATEVTAEWHPKLPAGDRTNLLPNSSFECGTAGWGSYAPDLNTWMGNVYQLVGELDTGGAVHGDHSLRIPLSAKAPPTFYFDWFDPIRQPVLAVVAAHHGWAPVPKGAPCTLSVWLKADRPGVQGLLLCRQAGSRVLRKLVSLSTDWQRAEFTFTPESGQIWVGAGLDLRASGLDEATVWLDGMQLEVGPAATAYQPTLPLEVLAALPEPGGIATATPGAEAVTVMLQAANAGEAAAEATVSVVLTDFWDQETAREQVPLAVPARQSLSQSVRLSTGGKAGFFRVHLLQGERPLQPALRCARLRPVPETASRFGMNHAYPWDFLLPLAQRGGVTAWRDWSVQWRTLQPKADSPFDFREPDFQIDRVVRQRGEVLVLFPFPSSTWASTADEAAVTALAERDYERARLPLAFRPKDEAAFSGYIAASVRHYRDRVKVYQVFNEALYTTYSLPAKAGHTVADYVRLLRLAHAAIKAEQPDALVVGGLGIWADSSWTRDFVEAGGMQSLDVLDLHLYPHGRPEPYAESLAQLRSRLVERGESKPIWITELGCYADDDPPRTPMKAYFGDAAMRRALHATEREATAWLVCFSALTAAQGVDRIFLHAGTCGEINGVDAGGILFEYGGAPRKMLAGIAAMASLLPPGARYLRSETLPGGVTSHGFETPAGQVGVAWSGSGRTLSLTPAPGTTVLDLMGNPAGTGATVQVGREPVYLVRPRP